MLEFLENRIVMHIKHLQEDPTLGCPGVRLIEYILRPSCVQRLIHVEDRQNQCVQLKDLEAEVIKIGIDATHNWKSCEGLDIGYNKVSTLLGSLAWKSLLERQSRDLQDFHMKIQSLGTMNGRDQSNSNINKGRLSTTSFWQMPQRLLYRPLDKKLDDMRREHHDHHKETMSKLDEHHKETMSKLDDMVYLIQNLEQGMQNMQRELLLEVCSKIDDLMLFSVEMQKSQIPKLAYLCAFGKRKLLTRLVPNLDRIQLHLMCESIYGFHEVANQEGCVVYFGTEYTKRFLAMVAWGLKVATILTKIGAHVACGMGAMVPDMSDGVTFAALILDTPGFLDYQLPLATLESLPSDVKKHSRISNDDHSEAQRWLQEFLEPKCQNKMDFYKKFRLKKVRYTRAKGCIAWICDECILLHQNEIDELR
jgi:hypothetical protein